MGLSRTSTQSPSAWGTRSTIGSRLFPSDTLETDVSANPTVSYPFRDLRRCGAKCDGVTDDTAAVQLAANIGGTWEFFGSCNITGTITITKGVKFRSIGGGASPNPPASGQPRNAFFLHNFSGTFFDLVGDNSDDKVAAGVTFEGITFVQKNGNGTGASGVCLRIVSTSDVKRVSWVRIRDCNLETASGVNDWNGCILIDGSANANQVRDIFVSGCRLVAGTQASYAIKCFGGVNLFVSDTEGNLTNANLQLDGDSTHLATSIFVDNSTFAGVALDHAVNCYLTNISCSSLSMSANTTDCLFYGVVGSSPASILGTRNLFAGKDSDLHYKVISTDAVRYNLGSNLLSASGIIASDTALAAGTNYAASGALRLANAGQVMGRNAANSGDIEALRVGSDNNVKVGSGQNVDIGGSGKTLSFYGHAAAAQTNITGSRGGNAALQSLLNALVGYGLITDGTTA
jgi:hypothetical protein